MPGLPCSVLTSAFRYSIHDPTPRPQHHRVAAVRHRRLHRIRARPIHRPLARLALAALRYFIGALLTRPLAVIRSQRVLSEGYVLVRPAGEATWAAEEQRLEIIREATVVHADLASQHHQVDASPMATPASVAGHAHLVPKRRHFADGVDGKRVGDSGSLNIASR